MKFINFNNVVLIKFVGVVGQHGKLPGLGLGDLGSNPSNPIFSE